MARNIRKTTPNRGRRFLSTASRAAETASNIHTGLLVGRFLVRALFKI